MPESPSGNELTSRASISPSRSFTIALRPGLSSARAALAAPAANTVERAAEVEVGQPRGARCLAVGDAVEVFFHLGREVVVDEVAEVPLEQLHHCEREKRRAPARCPF